MVAALPLEEQAGVVDGVQLSRAWGRCGVEPFNTNPEAATLGTYAEALTDLSGPSDLLPVIEGLLKEREE